MLTPECIPQVFKANFGDKISVHGLMAAFLCCGDSRDVSKYAAWMAVWPTLQDFEENMPMLWPEHLKERIHRETASTRTVTEYKPPPARTVLSSMGGRSKYPFEYEGPLVQQEKNFEKCFRAVRSVFPDTDRMSYCYYWLIVNTRSFYHLPRGADTPKERNDAIALCPFADYFNHTDVGNVSVYRFDFGMMDYANLFLKCKVSFDENGYTVQTTKAYGI
jgi:hypothetical protein